MMAKGDLRTCLRCGGTWRQRMDAKPKRCGKRGCETPYWNTPRREPKAGA
jgi:hypothetical protein